MIDNALVEGLLDEAEFQDRVATSGVELQEADVAAEQSG